MNEFLHEVDETREMLADLEEAVVVGADNQSELADNLLLQVNLLSQLIALREKNRGAS